MQFVLASGSPRRLELLNMLGARFEVRISDVDEQAAGDGITHPAMLVKTLAAVKCRDVMAGTDLPVLAADTIVVHNGEVLGKPTDTRHAARMIATLSGERHTVYTGVAVGDKGVTTTDYCATDVYFRKLSDDEIARYVATGEPMDKAGGYGAQGFGALLIDRIDGDFWCVVGLPLNLTARLLQTVGVNLL